MQEILIGSIAITLLHALLPNHWLPLLAIGQRQGWDFGRLLRVTAYVGMAHAGSTVFIGSILAFLGWNIADRIEAFTHWIGPAILIALGLWFMYRHHTHHHFQLPPWAERINPTRSVVWTLAIAMFFSPCLEIEGYFLLAGPYGKAFVLLLGLSYVLLSVSGMLVWITIVRAGARRFDWHALEHHAGMITGFTLIATGAWSLFFSH